MRRMEPPSGFEPETLGLRYRCSTAELRWQPRLLYIPFHCVPKNRGKPGKRTLTSNCDLRFNNPLTCMAITTTSLSVRANEVASLKRTAESIPDASAQLEWQQALFKFAKDMYTLLSPKLQHNGNTLYVYSPFEHRDKKQETWTRDMELMKRGEDILHKGCLHLQAKRDDSTVQISVDAAEKEIERNHHSGSTPPGSSFKRMQSLRMTASVDHHDSLTVTQDKYTSDKSGTVANKIKFLQTLMQRLTHAIERGASQAE